MAVNAFIIIFVFVFLFYISHQKGSLPIQQGASPIQYVLPDLYSNNAVVTGIPPVPYDMVTNYDGSDPSEVIAVNYPADHFALIQAPLQNAFRYAMSYVLGIPPSMIITGTPGTSSRGTTMIYFDIIAATPRDKDGNLITGYNGEQSILFYNIINALFSTDKQTFFDTLKTQNWADSVLMPALDSSSLPNSVTFTPASSGTLETNPQVLTQALIAFGFPEGTEVYYNDQPANVGTIVTPRL